MLHKWLTANSNTETNINKVIWENEETSGITPPYALTKNPPGL